MPKPTSPADPPSAGAARGSGWEPLRWEPDAEQAMSRVPFFDRGQTRLAAVALTRSRGLAAVTLEIVNEAKAKTVR